MRWRWSDTRMKTIIQSQVLLVVLLTIGSLGVCEGSRRAQRRKDSNPGLYFPAPSAESIQALAEAMGAAGFESYTEGKALVKRLIPADSQPDLDVVEHQGVIGRAGVDFPALPNIPPTGFNCKNVPTGYYADLETDCQVFHICDTSRKISFLCPNGTIFSQSHLICDWWFKVDCASSPALYESSVEYYSNEQKKSQKITKSLSKHSDLQQIGIDSNVRAESRRASINVPSTTERLHRHRQKLYNDTPTPTTKPTSRSYQALFNINPTPRIQAPAGFENKRRNLVQLISNNFGNNHVKTTLPTYYDIPTRRTTAPAGDYNSIKEMQEAAETASFTQNQNRQFLQNYNSKNFRPFPVYNPNLPPKSAKTKNNPSLTTLYDIQSQPVPPYTPEATTKRHTLIPYTKSYVSSINEKREPYTRPGVSLLKNFLDKERNRTYSETTEKFVGTTAKGAENNKSKSSKSIKGNENIFESSTKIPHTTRDDKISETASTNIFETYSTGVDVQTTTEPTYQERKQRLLKNINFDSFKSTENLPQTTVTEKYYGDQPNRPGLIVPSSLTPKTLHSLAIYYATAMDNLSTSQPRDDNEATTPATDDFGQTGDELPNLFSHQTISKYSSLFGHGASNAELLEEIKLDPNGTYNELAEDLSIQMSQASLATSPQIRELAQVFTHALSAYLQDPVQFRKVLSDIRPTPPSFADMLTATDDSTNTEPTTTVNEDDDEILGFSDDHKLTEPNNSFRDAKALKLATDYTFETTTTVRPTTTEIPSTSYVPTTPRNPFRCCGRISASYTTAPTPTIPYYFTTSPPSTLNRFSNSPNVDDTTRDSYTLSKYGGLNNNTYKPYGHEWYPTEGKIISDYTEVTNLPTAWDDDVSDSTLQPITNSHQMFESKKIRTTTYTVPEPSPTYFPDTESVELENEEELQRAHSQSFVSPQSNTLRQGKQINIHDKNIPRKPSFDLEAPTYPDIDTTTLKITTQSYTTTQKDQTESYTTTSPISSSIFTSPDTEKTTYEFQWPTTFENWQSTIIDPITLNDGLSATGHDESFSKLVKQTNNLATTTNAPSTTYYSTTEQAQPSTVHFEITTLNDIQSNRAGKALREPTSTEVSQDLTTIADTVVEKAKEIMGGMNSTTTQKLMNVMKKTKSKTVKRLILLLVQTCDDDHNSTAEASKKALLEALMAVSQKDMEDIAKEELATETTIPDIDYVQTTQFRRSDRIPVDSRHGKSLNFDAKAVNSLTNPTTQTSETSETEITTQDTISTTFPSRRGARKFQTRTTEETTTTTTTIADKPFAQARVAVQDKTQSDTRAIELLRSLYTIAAKFG